MNPNRYLKTQKIGEGAYGTVYKGVDSCTEAIVALKKYKLDPYVEGIPGQALREISILSELNHPNIIKQSKKFFISSRVRDQVIQNGKLHLVMDYYQYNLAQLMTNESLILNFKSIVFQILQAIECCHKHKIIHRDLQPSNIMIDIHNLKPILIDFGTARKFTNKPQTHNITQLWYRAPEMMKENQQYDYAVDMWSIGCIIGEIILESPIFNGQSEIHQMELIENYFSTSRASIQEELVFIAQKRNMDLRLIDLLNRLLQYQPQDRINVQQAMEHAFFQE